MIGDLFDSPWKILIVAVVILVLFGSKKMPDAARSLGRSMHILKAEVEGLHEDEPEPGASGAPAAFKASAELAAPPQPDQRTQLDELQQQVRDLQRAAAMDIADPSLNGGTSAEAKRSDPR